MKPMLASDYDESKLRFPLLVQPKIDGVRACNLEGVLTGRSLKTHANRYVTTYFTRDLLRGLDGEMAAERETHPDLCRLTTSALNTIEGSPWILWHVFDYVRDGAESMSYEKRYELLKQRLALIQAEDAELATHIKIVPSKLVHTVDELNAADEAFLDQGYEGTILRDPAGLFKQGRSTPKEGGLLRIKRFIEEEARVYEIEEGQTNLNEAKTNELGYTERSTHQENMAPNGMVGALHCTLLKDLVVNKKILGAAGTKIIVSPGRMLHDDRIRYFQNQDQLIGKVIKFQFFPKGVKDKPRFPTFQSIRMESDL